VTSHTDDSFLDAKVKLRQPATGFRSGLDAVMLAAAVPALSVCELLELGCGAGAASLCVARRVPRCSVVGVDIDAALATLANENACANGLSDRVRFLNGDIFSLPAELRRGFDHVFSNPPFHDSDSGNPPPNDARETALHDRGQFGDWLKAGMKRVAPDGTFTVILRADRLSEALAALPDRGLTIFPLWPREGEPAKRVILQSRKNSRAPLSFLPGLVLHEADGRYTAAAQGILRDGASLALSGARL
jgi:tRNA1Val (adenine37-N6)-methyltransferase